MNPKNMRECDNSKIHVRNNSLLSICLLIMLGITSDKEHTHRIHSAKMLIDILDEQRTAYGQMCCSGR